MDRVQHAHRAAVSGIAHVLAERLDGGCGSEHRHAGAHRRAGDQSRSAGGFPIRARAGGAHLADCTTSARSIFRRTWIIPALRMEVDRVHAAELGLTQKDIVDNVITALNSNAMIAPNYWVGLEDRQQLLPDRAVLRNGTAAIHNLARSEEHSAARAQPERTRPRWTRWSSWCKSQSPTEVDHYQIQRIAEVYVTPKAKTWAG